MRRCWGENVGGHTKRLCYLLLFVGLVIVLLVASLPSLSFLPHRVFLSVENVSLTALSSPPLSTTITSSSSSASTTSSSVEHPHGAPTRWGRLAIFFVLAGLKGDQYVSALQAETAGDCRSLPINSTSAKLCQRPVDVYVLYSSNDELKAAQAALNTARSLLTYF